MENIKVHRAEAEPTPTQPDRIIKNPWWGNPEKTIVRCQFFMGNGEVLEASVSDTEEGNPDWHEIMETFGIEEIDKRTEDLEEAHLKEHTKKKQWLKDQEEKEKSDALFAAKLEAFEMDPIKNSTNRELKSMIRKAKSVMEVMTYTSILVMKEFDLGKKE